MSIPATEGRLTREAVVERFCRLGSLVNEHVHRFGAASDCICDPSTSPFSRFEYSEDVLEFIEAAVRAALVRHATEKIENAPHVYTR